MYTIKQASARSGVSISLLRAWERRYGVVIPERTASGYRLYDDAAINRLRAMRQLVAAGWAASQAADSVLRTPETALADAGGGRSITEEAPVPALGSSEAAAFVAAAAAYDATGIESSLDAFFSRGSFERVIDDIVLPAVAALGDAWAAGRLDVAAEHLASASVQRRLAALFDLGGAPGSGPTVVVGLPPGSRHEIGALSFGVALRRQGVNVLYLGPDVPVVSWVHVVSERSPRMAVIGVTRSTDEGPAREVATALDAAMPGTVVAMGGAAAEHAATGAASTKGGAIRVLPDRVTDAATEVADLVRSR